MKSYGEVHARIHIFAAVALGRSTVASPTFGFLYPRKIPLVRLQEAGVRPRVNLDTE